VYAGLKKVARSRARLRFSHASQIVGLLTSNKKARSFDLALVIGGGENRTLVLSKLYTNDYMLIAIKILTLLEAPH
jgi:hypothetical protein